MLEAPDAMNDDQAAGAARATTVTRRQRRGEVRAVRGTASVQEAAHWPLASVPALVLALVALAACTQAPPPPPSGFEAIESRFDSTTDGWTTTEAQAPYWEAPGHLVVVDDGSDWQFAVAPAKFAGDWRGAEGVSFRVRADPGPLTYPVRLRVTGPAGSVYVEFPIEDLEPGEWVELSAPFEAGAWRQFAGEETIGALATQDELEAVLADVDDLRIRLDLTSKFTGDEANLLDDVVVE
jgi:hypothetical protein